MSRLPPQEPRPSCLDQFKRGERESDGRRDDYASAYHGLPQLPVALDGENRVKEALDELERQNRYLRALVVSLSATVVRQVTAKK